MAETIKLRAGLDNDEAPPAAAYTVLWTEPNGAVESQTVQTREEALALADDKRSQGHQKVSVVSGGGVMKAADQGSPQWRIDTAVDAQRQWEGMSPSERRELLVGRDREWSKALWHHLPPEVRSNWKEYLRSFEMKAGTTSGERYEVKVAGRNERLAEGWSRTPRPERAKILAAVRGKIGDSGYSEEEWSAFAGYRWDQLDADVQSAIAQGTWGFNWDAGNYGKMHSHAADPARFAVGAAATLPNGLAPGQLRPEPPIQGMKAAGGGDSSGWWVQWTEAGQPRSSRFDTEQEARQFAERVKRRGFLHNLGVTVVQGNPHQGMKAAAGGSAICPKCDDIASVDSNGNFVEHYGDESGPRGLRHICAGSYKKAPDDDSDYYMKAGLEPDTSAKITEALTRHVPSGSPWPPLRTLINQIAAEISASPEIVEQVVYERVNRENADGTPRRTMEADASPTNDSQRRNQAGIWWSSTTDRSRRDVLRDVNLDPALQRVPWDQLSDAQRQRITSYFPPEELLTKAIGTMKAHDVNTRVSLDAVGPMPTAREWWDLSNHMERLMILRKIAPSGWTAFDLDRHVQRSGAAISPEVEAGIARWLQTKGARSGPSLSAASAPSDWYVSWTSKDGQHHRQGPFNQVRATDLVDRLKERGSTDAVASPSEEGGAFARDDRPAIRQAPTLRTH